MLPLWGLALYCIGLSVVSFSFAYTMASGRPPWRWRRHG